MSNDDIEDRGGPDNGEAQPEEATLTSQEGDDTADHEYEPFDELDEEFQPNIMYGMQADGLPGAVVPETESDIPVLSPETLVCMGDMSEFVVRDEYGHITKRFKAQDVVLQPNGAFLAPDYDRSLFPAGIEVEPIRPPCKHYVRQTSQFEHNAQHKVVYRLCAARRTTEGTFMTVRDRGVWACSMREPRDLASEQKYLDDFDALKVKQGKERMAVDMFDRTPVKDPTERRSTTEEK